MIKIKKIMMLLVFTVGIMLRSVSTQAASGVEINKANFPDKSLREVASTYDKNADDFLSNGELKKVVKLNITWKALGEGIKDYKGIEHFSNLKYLSLGSIEGEKVNSSITLDLSKNKKLVKLEIDGDYYIKNLKLNGCRKLKKLYIYTASVRKLDLTGCVELENLEIGCKYLKALDVSSCKNLKSIVGLSMKSLTQINLGTIKKLQRLDLWNAPKLKRIDITKQTNLECLALQDIPLTSLNVSKNKKLESLHIYNVPLKKLSVKNQTKLKSILVAHTNITKLDLSNTLITKEKYTENSCTLDEGIEIEFAQ